MGLVGSTTILWPCIPGPGCALTSELFAQSDHASCSGGVWVQLQVFTDKDLMAELSRTICGGLQEDCHYSAGNWWELLRSWNMLIIFSSAPQCPFWHKPGEHSTEICPQHPTWWTSAHVSCAQWRQSKWTLVMSTFDPSFCQATVLQENTCL